MVFAYVALAVVVLVLAVFTPIVRNTYTRAMLYATYALYFVMCKDMKKAKAGDTPLPPTDGSAPVKTVRIILVRHAQSVWNCLFNQFDAQWPIRAAQHALLEVYATAMEPKNSSIIDSPLSAKGHKQTDDLAGFVESNLASFPANTTVVTSNLRRAMETTLQGFAPFLKKYPKRVVVHSALQEASRNADAMSFSTQSAKIADTPIAGLDTNEMHAKVLDAAYNAGNKGFNSNVNKRHAEFNEFLFSQPKAGEAVVIVGHSLWFKRYFNSFLPPQSVHQGKDRKMQNCAVVAMNVNQYGNGAIQIDESSVTVMYKGFQ